MHGALVAAEVALAVLLVAGATMFTRSVSRLYAIDTGFDATNAASLDLVAPTRVMAGPERQAFFERVTTRVGAMPGVAAVGLVTRLPLRDGGWQGTVTIEDRADLREGREPNALYRVISPAYFEAMGIAMRDGRPFSTGDGRGAPAVGIVSQSFAEQMWPGRSPLGRRVQHTFGDEPRWVTVVGVAAETRMTRMTGDNPLVLYVPLAQSGAPEGPVLVVKGAAGEPPPLAAIRAAVRETDDRVAIGRVTTLDAVVAAAIAEPLRLRFFLSVLGTLALVMGVVGIYSVVSYAVTRRRTEFGVRLALGASPARILGDVLRRSLAPVAIGVTIGTAGALALSSTVSRVIYGYRTRPPASLAAGPRCSRRRAAGRRRPGGAPAPPAPLPPLPAASPPRMTPRLPPGLPLFSRPCLPFSAAESRGFSAPTPGVPVPRRAPPEAATAHASDRCTTRSTPGAPPATSGPCGCSNPRSTTEETGGSRSCRWQNARTSACRSRSHATVSRSRVAAASAAARMLPVHDVGAKDVLVAGQDQPTLVQQIVVEDQRQARPWSDRRVLEVRLAALNISVQVDHERQQAFFAVGSPNAPIGMRGKSLAGAIAVEPQTLVQADHWAPLKYRRNVWRHAAPQLPDLVYVVHHGSRVVAKLGAMDGASGQ